MHGYTIPDGILSCFSSKKSPAIAGLQGFGALLEAALIFCLYEHFFVISPQSRVTALCDLIDMLPVLYYGTAYIH